MNFFGYFTCPNRGVSVHKTSKFEMIENGTVFQNQIQSKTLLLEGYFGLNIGPEKTQVIFLAICPE